MKPESRRYRDPSPRVLTYMARQRQQYRTEQECHFLTRKDSAGQPLAECPGSSDSGSAHHIARHIHRKVLTTYPVTQSFEEQVTL